MEQLGSRKIKSPLRDVLAAKAMHLSEDNFIGYDDGGASYIDPAGGLHIEVQILNFPSDLMPSPHDTESTWEQMVSHFYGASTNESSDYELSLELSKTLQSTLNEESQEV